MANLDNNTRIICAWELMLLVYNMDVQGRID